MHYIKTLPDNDDHYQGVQPERAPRVFSCEDDPLIGGPPARTR